MRYLLINFLLFLAISAFATDNNSAFIQIIETKNWNKLSTLKDKNQISVATWLKLISEKKSDFHEISNFIRTHPNWPRIEKFKQRIEDEKIDNYSNKDIINWFSQFPPDSFAGIRFYISKINDPKIIKSYVKHIWSEEIFLEKDEDKFLNQYGKFLSSEDYLARINFLLYNKRAKEAKRIIKFIPKKERNIYALRIRMLENNSSVIELTDHHLNDPGILHNLAQIHENNEDDDSLIKTLLRAANLENKFQKYFWKMKIKLIRELVLQKKYKEAYKFAISHGHSDIKEKSEAEWLAGWIALRFLNEPKKAVLHFKTFYDQVKMPISLSRGAYWIGRSYEALKNTKQSNEWYSNAAKYYTSFYGQLSICKINNCKLSLPKKHNFSPKSKAIFQQNSLVIAAKILQDSPSNKFLMKEFLLKAMKESKNEEEIRLIAEMNFKKTDFNLFTELAKQASYKNVIVIDRSYPIPKYVYSGHRIDHALILSLIRQESVFNHQAVSSAGAMGLMQMMPFVAERTAKALGVRYNKNKLLNDPNFNSFLGSAHIKELLAQYDNSYILAIAAYNAGSKPVNKWIEDNGDPRKMKSSEEIIDWIEKITFHETRNYVQRVLENRAIYYLILNKKSSPRILNP